MTLEQIRSRIVDELIASHNIWEKKLSNTNPGNYGVDYFEIELNRKDVWVDIPAKKFNFKNAFFHMYGVRIGSSSEEHSHDFDFTKIAEGQGAFEFVNESISIQNADVTVDLDLFAN